jgi:nitroreductase
MAYDDPWYISEDCYPTAGEPEEKLRFMLNYAVLAPSGHNTQPWLFSVHDDEVELHADRTHGLPVVDPEDRELIISFGSAPFCLRVAMRHFGCEGEVEDLPDSGDPDLLARVRLGSDRSETEEERMLFQAIPKRRSNRGPFEDRQMPERLLYALQAAAGEEAAWLHLVEEEETKHAIAELIAEGDRIQLAA